MNPCFNVTNLGLLHYYLGIQFDSVEGGIVMHQAMYIEKLFRRFGFEDCKPISTLVETSFRFSSEDVVHLILLCINKLWDVLFMYATLDHMFNMQCPS